MSKDNFLYILSTIASFGIATDCFVGALLFCHTSIHSTFLLIMIAVAAFTLNLILYYADALTEAQFITSLANWQDKKSIASIIIALLAGAAMGCFTYGIYINFPINFPVWIMILFSVCYMLGTTTLLFKAVKDLGTSKLQKLYPMLCASLIIFTLITLINYPNIVPTYVYIIALILGTVGICATAENWQPYISFTLVLIAAFAIIKPKAILAIYNTVIPVQLMISEYVIYIVAIVAIVAALCIMKTDDIKDFLAMTFITATIALSYTWFDQGVFALQSVLHIGIIPATISMSILVLCLTLCEIIFCLDQAENIGGNISKVPEQSMLSTIVFSFFIALNSIANLLMASNTFNNKFSNMVAKIANGTLSPITMTNNLLVLKSKNNGITPEYKALTVLSISSILSVALFSMHLLAPVVTNIFAIIFANIFICFLSYQALIQIPKMTTDASNSSFFSTKVQDALDYTKNIFSDENVCTDECKV